MIGRILNIIVWLYFGFQCGMIAFRNCHVNYDIYMLALVGALICVTMIRIDK
jgi:NhaP-type Na+/H+ or K+/H+ antiporter